MLPHELSMLRRQVGWPRFEPHDRLLLGSAEPGAAAPQLEGFRDAAGTLPRWQRQLVARRWTYPHRRPGRPIGAEVRELILRLAGENPSWGYLRTVGQLRKLGIVVSATSVRNIPGGAAAGAAA